MFEVAERTMADLMRVRPQHLRSVLVERDYADPSSSAQYVVTPFASDLLARLGKGLEDGSTARAWRVTGDYGSGKSSFALAFARWAAGQSHLLPERLRDVAPGSRLASVLVTGEREPVGTSLCRALRATLARLRRPPSKRLKEVLASAEAGDADAVLAAVEAVGDAARASFLAEGLLIVLDELGKNLEHAAAATDGGDLYLLQRLAELAARSGSSPIVVVAILHQAVTAYARDLPSVERREWEKVSGRYGEVVFAPPLRQVTELVAAALDVDVAGLPRTYVDGARDAMGAAARSGWYGRGAPVGRLVELSGALAPLDPMVLPVISRLLRRFGQSERSLFGFVSSPEPHGLVEHAACELGRLVRYGLHHLYDYVSANLSGTVEAGPAGTRWGVVDAVVRSAPAPRPVDLALLKSIGLVNLLDDPALSLTSDLACLSVAGTVEGGASEAADALRRLREARVVYDRGAGGGLCLWPHTSVDVETAFREALAGQADDDALLGRLQAALPSSPVVARRHYVETGTLRHFDVAYADPGSLDDVLAEDHDPATADGRVVLVLSRTERDRVALVDRVKAATRWPDTLVVGVTAPVAALAPLLRDLGAWRAVAEGTPALSGDRYARDEVARQVAMAEDRVRRATDLLLDIRSGGAPSTAWFHRGRDLAPRDARGLAERFSTICDDAFDHSPLVRNELLNRRNLSSAAARARSLLIEALAQAPEKPRLGLDPDKTPPEMAVYLSVLKAGNVHVERDGRHLVETPADDPLRLRPSLDRIGEVLRAVEDRRVPYLEVAAELTKAPYGVRAGLVPLLVATYLAINWHGTAVYEEGTYLEQVGGPEFARMLKEPEHFSIQRCAVEGVRAEVFARLGAVVLSEPSRATRPDLLDVVRPLLRFVARLPDHARRTRNLSVRAAAVRGVLLRVQDPTALVFVDLPKACGLEPFTADEALDEDRIDGYVRAMAGVVTELRDAYPGLLARVGDALGQALDAPGSLDGMRAVVSRRAERLLPGMAEPELKAFALRLADRQLPPKQWVESVGSLLARKPPERWAEPEEREFHHRLKILARRFGRVQAAHGLDALGAEPGRSAFRIVVTATDGRELEELLQTQDDDAEVSGMEAEFTALLARTGRRGLLAAARALVAVAGAGDGSRPGDGAPEARTGGEA